MRSVLPSGKYLKMPDPNKPNPNQSVAPPIAPQADLPPLPPDFQTASPATPAGSNESAAPPEISSIVSSPKKKYGGGRIIATILGVLLLVGGIAGGVILTQQQQNIREKAAGGAPRDCTSQEISNWEQVSEPGEAGTYRLERKSPTGEHCLEGTVTGGVNRLPLKESVCPSGTIADFTDKANSVFKCCKTNPYPQFAGTACRKQGGRVKWLGVSNCKGAGFVKEQIAPCKVVNPAQCSNIQAYDTSWKALTQADLIKLKPGASLNFCVAGSPSPASFDKARFTINGVLKPDTTTRRPGSTTDFCQSYTIQAEDETVDVTAQIHHPTQGWK